MTPFIKRDHLAYFALSVFWRASVHGWKKITPIDLGTYEELFRAYLNGEASFPENVSLQVVVCTDTASQNMFFTPSPLQGFRQPYRAYSFQARGIVFTANVGKLLSQPKKNLCCLTSPKKWIVACDWEPKTIESYRQIVTANQSLT